MAVVRGSCHDGLPKGEWWREEEGEEDGGGGMLETQGFVRLRDSGSRLVGIPPGAELPGRASRSRRPMGERWWTGSAAGSPYPGPKPAATHHSVNRRIRVGNWIWTKRQ